MMEEEEEEEWNPKWKDCDEEEARSWRKTMIIYPNEIKIKTEGKNPNPLQPLTS